MGQGSKSKWNSSSSLRYRASGVGWSSLSHFVLVLLNGAHFPILITIRGFHQADDFHEKKRLKILWSCSLQYDSEHFYEVWTENRHIFRHIVDICFHTLWFPDLNQGFTFGQIGTSY